MILFRSPTYVRNRNNPRVIVRTYVHVRAYAHLPSVIDQKTIKGFASWWEYNRKIMIWPFNWFSNQTTEAGGWVSARASAYRQLLHTHAYIRTDGE